MLCLFLCGALTLSLTAFLVGGPVGAAQHQEIGQHDRASDNSEAPSIWFGRGNLRVDKRGADSPFVWVPLDELEPLAAKISWIAEPPASESVVVQTAERWRATPVRGPPSSIARM